MDNVDGLGLLGDLLGDLFGVDVEGPGIDIREDRGAAFLEDGQAGGHEGIGGDDHFIALLDVEELGDDVHAGGAVGAGIGILHSVDLGELVLELLGLGAHGQRILLHGGESGFALGVVINGPHERIGDLQFHAVIGGVAAGDSAFGLGASMMFLVDRHFLPPWFKWVCDFLSII